MLKMSKFQNISRPLNSGIYNIFLIDRCHKETNIYKSEDYKIKHSNINKYRVRTQITFNIIQKSVSDYRSSWYTFLFVAYCYKLKIEIEQFCQTQITDARTDNLWM